MRPLVKKMETCRLHNSDMKKLVRIFQGAPSLASESKEKAYRKSIKEDIHNLPRRLRSSQLFVSSTNLCSTHKGLDAHLTNDIWAWLRHEIDGAIGKFLYPLIMSGVLTQNQELKVRQLEPVRRMWHRDFLTEMSAPPGRKPIQCGGAKWYYEDEQCPACMLARIGSDEDVLFALFAGMVGRMKSKVTGTDVLRGIVGWEKVRSKRLRFVRYWIKASSGGEKLLFAAGELGLQMKRMRAEWKEQQRCLRRSRQSHKTERSRSGLDAGQGASHHPADKESVIGIDITEPFQLKEWSPLSPHDSKLGPQPRPDSAEQFSPAAPLGFNIPGFPNRIPSTPLDQRTNQQPLGRSASNRSTLTIRPEDSISSVGLYPAPLRPQRPKEDSQTKPSPPRRHDSIVGDLPSLPQRFQSARHTSQPSVYSVASTRTIASYNGGAPAKHSIHTAPYDPLDNPFYDSPAPTPTQEQLVDKYRNLLAAHTETYSNPFVTDEEDDDVSGLPAPRPKSMYSAFGDGGFDDEKYEVADEDGEDEGEQGVGVGRRGSVASTNWDDLY